MSMKRWNVAEGDKELSQSIALEYDIPRFAAHLLVTRGYTEPEQIKEIIYSEDVKYIDPFTIADMDKAVERIKKAVKKYERIMVYGDYDVDGITATSLLYSYLASKEADVYYMLPSRDENGYGLHISAVEKMAEMGVRLIITVDNGISACTEIAHAAALGIDVVVTDHHQPPEILPEACAIVNPHRIDCPSKFKDYAGVGVAFKLVCALEGDAESVAESYADLVALGTVADVVPLLGENRTLVRQGLELMRDCSRLGVEALMNVSNIKPSGISSSDIAYGLSPRINSAGRLGKPDRAVQLILTEDEKTAFNLAEELQEENYRRHKCEKEMAEEAWAMLRRNPDLMLDKIVVVNGQKWNHGVIGIFAAKMCETLGKPCIILSSDGEVTRGSGRSLGDFSLHDALVSCQDLLSNFGGHTLAVGLTMNTENVEEFRRRINEYAADIEMPVPEMRLDCVLPLSMINEQLVEDAEIMQPFGAANPSLMIGIKNVMLKDVYKMSGGLHQRLTVTDGRCDLELLLFNVATSNFAFRVGDRIDCAVAVGRDSYRGGGINAIVRDIKLSDTDVEEVIAADRNIEKLLRGEKITPEEAEIMLPERSDYETFYKYIRYVGFRGSFDVLAARLKKHNVTYPKIRTAIEAMKQSGLVFCQMNMGVYNIRLNDSVRKTNLEESSIIRALRTCLEL